MCGIFGIVIKNNTTYNSELIRSTIWKLAKFSETRGKDSSGISTINDHVKNIAVFKGPIRITKLLNTPVVKENLDSVLDQYGNGTNLILFGHSRLVTNGTQLQQENNQPVVKDGVVGIHNGIIVNVEKLWQTHSEIKRNYEIDTEVFLSLLRLKIRQTSSTINATISAIREVYGTVATALLFDDRRELVLATNNGSLYIATNEKDFLIFASEKFILTTIVRENHLENAITGIRILQVRPNTGYLLQYKDFNLSHFSFDHPSEETFETTGNNLQDNYNISVSTIESIKKQRSVLVDLSAIRINPGAIREADLLEYNIKAIGNLKRCTKCLLPETFPFIHFDQNGICNICNNYTPKNLPATKESLYQLSKKWRKDFPEPECLVPFSGGRDSSYLLHFLVRELGLRPITFTYDWGMVTDLARRNIARVCGKLGVENIIVSADIQLKRENIRKNVTAWLKRPSLGMIPLFMTGDKLFFYYINKLMKETGTNVAISGSNSLENTEFKVGFSGIDLDFSKKSIDSLKFINKLKLFRYVAENVMLNPSYINSSVFDTLFSFYSRYFLSRKELIFFYGFIKWDEQNIEKTLIGEYDWELSPDTDTTWRIGDGTVGFYNYIYYTVAGFSEIETFRSNQIREGLITRKEALGKIYNENKPRYESIKWYLETIGMDYERTIKIINKIPKLYHL